MNIEFKCLKCTKISVRYDANEFDIQCPECHGYDTEPLRPVPYPEDDRPEPPESNTTRPSCRCCGKPTRHRDFPIHTRCIVPHWDQHSRGNRASRCQEFKNRVSGSYDA